jgi:hypothetical protein
MRIHLAAALAASLLFTASAVTFAGQAAKTSAKTATHVVEKMASGTVKSIDAGKLVLKTRKGDMTFNLGSTKTENIAAGSAVQVHYKSEGKNRVATSVVVEPRSTAKK